VTITPAFSDAEDLLTLFCTADRFQPGITLRTGPQ